MYYMSLFYPSRSKVGQQTFNLLIRVQVPARVLMCSDISFISALGIDLFPSSLLHIRGLDLLLVSFLLLLVIGVVRTGVFRERFGYFVCLVLFSAVVGFYLGFDGFVFFFLLTEFLILLLFLIISLNTVSRVVRQHQILGFSGLILLGGYGVFLLGVYYVPAKVLFIFQWVFASVYDIVANDLYLFYHFFFFDVPLSVFYLTLILSFFSIIFISFYFQYKKMQQNLAPHNRRVEILRQQEAVKQAM